SPCAPDNSPPGCDLIGALPEGCGVGVPSTEAPAAQLRLQVVPNPIVTGGKIEWTSASQAPMSLHLYDAAGRLVATRDLGTVIAGRHQLAWEEAFAGKKLGSGVYFLRWESGTTVAPAVRVVVTR
ncbi:MAG TPA: FlgD immunoglobulin-like domain containing protein, partial [Thermoanaerobaculia bacterium]